ncbi:hypothetical protein IAD21_01227 [Abditibacteriota bacterium]|nr:hypothetical protein IAD21_01227 [Abditibacteriota bacterium]
MTEQEAEALLNRIPRIWVPDASLLIERSGGRLPFRFIYTLYDNWELTYICYSDEPFPLVMVTKESFGLLYLPYEGIECDLDRFHGEKKILMESSLNLWLPLFRRNCWLSGCPIEATAHEKAEWMQGFSREELEAWNLKF